MRLYGFWRSIATYRVRIALNLKGIDYEEVDINLLKGQQHEESFGAVNPGHAVPALDIDGRVLTQSLPILEALDALYPQVPLFPADPFERAAAVGLALDTIADSHPLVVPRVRSRLTQQFGADEAAVEAFCAHFLALTNTTMEARIAGRSTAYAMGDAPCVADIAIAGHLVSCGYYGVDTTAWPHLHELGERLQQIDAFARSHPFERRKLSA
ncbi:maleylacetoacetate isomerase [Histidinibacterium lentulum]|uniref:Maleylacetoacetate isomerase n=1 Tax=Histidinibacterium lentulum TaxID=2480588 RepID=A0A3N2R8Q9_9RHOB|nr:maleylacetoacetate isomerase [Histidinibacterium lentulum]ROU03803.1 maleylacetoacetate isomerase [Histidinibacterium lentulum]